MIGRGGRDRLSRHEDRNQGGQSNPPSRHLWVGNLPLSITENGLSNLFARFGELERVAFQPGRSYAFVNYRSTEDAVAAMKTLQGSLVVGNAIKVEFTKVDKSSSSSSTRDPEHLNRHRSSLRSSSPFSPRDSRLQRHPSPDPYHPDKPKSVDKGGTEPSEVLWVGFPAQLELNESIIRRAFSPFGEIEKVTTFPGRTYAFVRFRSIVSASRAKESLHGKLFGDPRVHICFARSESGGPANRAGQRFKPEDYQEHESFRRDRSYGSPRFASLESENRDVYDLRRRGLPREREYPSLSRGPVLDPWDLPEETDLFQAVKKRPRTDSFLHHENDDLLEYSFSELKREKQAAVQIPDRSMDFNAYQRERRGLYENVDTGFQPSSLPIERRIAAIEPSRPSLKDWKWEGTIAKGGTPVCRARCFPVGKAMDMLLPDFLDCTARTSLDMLSKHYYQALASWVVFFVPDNDSEIGFYNEFMHYLEEKQRAAVTKLDEQTTMFLVPPSEFSEKVLKVPGRLSIAGVALRLENPIPDPNPNRPSLDRYPDLNHRYHNNGDGLGSSSMVPSLPANFQNVHGVSSAEDYSYDRRNARDRFEAQQSSGSRQQESYYYNSGKVADSVPDSRQFQQQPNVVPDSRQFQQQPNVVSDSRQFQQQPNVVSDSRQFQQQSNVVPGSRQFQQQPNVVPSGVHQLTSGVALDEETDPQKRLQATLQLAAALLQQIQGKGT